MERRYKNPILLTIGELTLAGIVFYFLLQELTIIQIAACVLLGALLTGMSLAVYGKELMPSFMKIFNSKVLRKVWILVIIWTAFAIWVLLEIF